MPKLHQLSFDFTFSDNHSNRRTRNPLPWRIRRLVTHHRLTEVEARFYASQMGLPVDRHE